MALEQISSYPLLPAKPKELQMAFSINEPAINRYDEGGAFNRHVDRAPFTINVLLSEPGAQ